MMLFKQIRRPVAGTVLFTFLAMVLQPLSVLAQDRPQSPASRRAAETGEERFSRTLNEIHEILKEVAPRAAMPHMFPRGQGEMDLRAIGPNMRIEVERAKPLPGVNLADKVKQLRAKAKDLASLEEHVRAGFDETEKHIKDKNLPAAILARHEEALKAYEARSAEFRALLAAVERTADAGGAPLQTAVNDLASFVARYPNQRAHTPTDPNNLPWGSPRPVHREPYTTPQQFRTGKLFGDPVRVAQAGSLSGISLPSTILPATPVPADTTPTEDVQITQAIRDLAASLNNNPVQIYNWVRNNIHFIPSYGSIQGSDMTLQTKRGNSFDTASLLIGLFRAANIPARYVYGTIEVPADKAMNWVGGMNVAHAAVDLMRQGGIPSIAIVQSGTVRSIRMEHVWVEAFVDYVPSRGAVNRQPDTWVPLDASFKQHSFPPGLDVRTAVPFDSQSFLNQLRQDATVNEQEGWTQNVNTQLLQQILGGYQSQLHAYVVAQKPNPTVADLLGTQSIVREDSSILHATLPYKVLAVGAKFQFVPPNLQHRLTLKVYDTSFDQALDSPSLQHSLSLPAINSRRFGITYLPSSPADAQLLQSYRDQGIKLLPVYLLRMTPALRLDQETIATGVPIGMGQPQYFQLSIADPHGQNASPTQYGASAGDEIVFGINGAGISSEQIQLRASRVDTNSAAENLFQIALHYWMEHDLYDEMAGRMHRAKPLRLPSHGLFSAPLSVRFLFGIPRTGSYKSRVMDVKRSVMGAVGLSGQSTVPFVRQAGMQGSFLEGAVFEQLFGRPTGSSISAVHVLHYSNRAGIRIYEITQANYAAVINSLQVSADVKADIANAVAAGRTVTVPMRDIEQRAWTGTGYIILDTETGAGAYLIDGGLNGAEDPDCEEDNRPPSQPITPWVIGFLLAVFLIILFVIITGGTGGPLVPAALAAVFMLFYPVDAEAAFNRNKCCEDAKRDAESASNNLNVRIDEWEQNILGLRDRGHWDAIAQEHSRLNIAIGKIERNCRRGPSDVEPEWRDASARGTAFVTTVPRPPN